eukprot:1009922_1
MSASDEDNKCLDISYDVVTILISIADITTDVIVLISFYVEGRITFFVISLIIFDHCSNGVQCIVYDSVCQSQTVSIFFILLPFGSIVSLIVGFQIKSTQYQ